LHESPTATHTLGREQAVLQPLRRSPESRLL
jgi:hypothetical protein